MKYIKILSIILVVSISLTLFGYFVDDDTRNPNIINNLGEIVMLTALILVILTTIYFGIAFTFKKIKTLLA